MTLYEEDDDPVAVAGFCGLFGLFRPRSLVLQYHRIWAAAAAAAAPGAAWHAAATGYPSTNPLLPPDAALQMMQTVGVLPPAAQMQAGGQPAAGYPQEGPVPYGGGAYPQRPANASAVRRWRRHCGPGSGGGDSACRRRVPRSRRRGSRNRVRDRSTRRLRQWRSGRRHFSDHDGHRAAGRGREGQRSAPPPASFMCSQGGGFVAVSLSSRYLVRWLTSLS